MKFIISAFFVLFFQQAFSNVKITGELVGFVAAKGVEVYLPVQGYVNSSRRAIYPAIKNKININFDIPFPVFIKINVGGIRNIFILARPGDDIKFKLFDTNDKYNSLRFEGSNAPGQYWYNLYNIRPLDNHIRHSVLMTAILDKNKDVALKKLGQFIYDQSRPLDSLYKEKKIDATFYNIAKTDLRALHIDVMIQEIGILQEKIDNKEQIARNRYIINVLNAYAAPENMVHTKTYFGAIFLGSYYSSDLATSKESVKNSNYQLGPYKGRLSAPRAMQTFLLGDILLAQQIYKYNEFDFGKAYSQYKLDFPQSPYISLINSINSEANDKSNLNDNLKVIIDQTSNYNSFEDLKRHFSGKNIYIDLWATWCMPCRMEFPAYDLIKADLKKNNINCVFISIDKPEAKPLWKDVISKSHLEGYHIIANNNLMADIKKSVYKNDQVNIPRYILLNKAGRIISMDAPRPSSLKLAKLFKEL